MQSDEDRQENIGRGVPPVGIGSGSYIQNAILDKNCRIGQNVRIVNETDVVDADVAPGCVIRDGLPIVCKDAQVPDNWKLVC